MPYEFYKILHLTGLILLFSGLMGLLMIKMTAGQITGPTKKLIFISHGVGLLFILVSGFGLLARLGLVRELPQWIYIKLAIWLYFGAAVALVQRKAEKLGKPLYLMFLVVFILAASVAIYKPQF